MNSNAELTSVLIISKVFADEKIFLLYKSCVEKNGSQKQFMRKQIKPVKINKRNK